MDVGTHALASFVLVRAALPRAPRAAWAAVLLAGTIADLDALSALVGPSAYLKWHRTDSHSLLVSIAVSALLTGVYLLLNAKPSSAAISPPALFTIILLAQLLHLALDACQSEGIALFWPFSGHRVTADWLASIDPWIITLLIAAILLPELLRLVSDEIGAKDKRPRGRLGAIVGFVLVLLYIGVRATLHSNVVAAMESRTYQGQSPRAIAAFPESASLFTWHGIVETDSALHELIVNAGPGSAFDPESGVALFKPEPSAILDKARNPNAARRFLAVARFPKATVEKTSDGGYEVQLRDLRYAAAGETQHEVVALVKMDANGKLVDEALAWARDLRSR
jgi:membrane-bound metal-dependent hydrolase YbcI (DUF457 family)